MPDSTIKAHTVKKTFSRTTSVQADIHAPAAAVWKLLTDASGFPAWNSTVISIEGEIRPGGAIALKSTLDEKRIFKLKIKEFVAEKRLVWGDAMGSRVYTLTPTGEGVDFEMTEKIGGPIFPLFSRMIPPFDESFERFTADLKKAAESMR